MQPSSELPCDVMHEADVLLGEGGNVLGGREGSGAG